MLATIGEFLPAAIGVAISPLPIAAVILMLLSQRAGPNSVGFVGGWFIGVALVGAVVLAFGTALSGDTDDPSSTVGVVKLALGGLLLFLAWYSWHQQKHSASEPTTPKWMSKIDDMRPIKAIVLGFILSALNPKNFLLILAGTTSIASVGMALSEEIFCLLVFVCLASLSVVTPIITYFCMRERAEIKLATLKDWLIVNNTTVMIVLLVIFGAKLIGNGISILS